MTVVHSGQAFEGSEAAMLAEQGIDPAVRVRIAQSIDSLLDALGAPNRNLSRKSIADAREAADTLMRAVARLLLEIAAAETGGAPRSSQ